MSQLFGISKRAKKIRKRIIANAEFLIANAGSIHYDQNRPTDYNFRALPWTADCSGSSEAILRDAGAPDPSKRGFDGYGNTDTILAYGDKISRLQARRGDLVLFHIGSDGKHVCVLLQSPRYTPDPEVESHGGEYGPLRMKLSAEEAYHKGETVTFIRSVPVKF